MKEITNRLTVGSAYVFFTVWLVYKIVEIRSNITPELGSYEYDPIHGRTQAELTEDSQHGDVQDQPSGRVQHGLKPVEKIRMRPEQVVSIKVN